MSKLRVTGCQLSVLLLAMFSASVAQQPEVFTYKTETHLVTLAASVHDGKGALVRGLGKDAFSVTEDGVPQTVRFFARETDLPLSIGLIVDGSGSQAKFVKEHEEDIERFLQTVMGPKDEAFAVGFGNYLRLASDWSNDAVAITGGIRAYDHENFGGMPELGPKVTRVQGTALFDAVYFSVQEKLKGREQRRRVLLVLSDGEENSSEHDLLDAIEAAQNDDVLVYALRYTDAEPGKLNARDRYGVRVLDHLAEQTGGRVIDVSTADVGKAFAEIADELKSLYALAYQSTNRVRDGSFRKVVVTVDVPGLKVRTRAGYYAR